MSKYCNAPNHDTSHQSGALWRGLKFIGKTAVFAAGAAAVANAWLEYNSMPLGPRFEATFERYPSRFGDVSYAVKGQGKPLLLLHAPRIGASMAEWRQVFDALAEHHTVYALDYLGWGNSDRTRALCSAAEMVEEIQFFVEDVIGEPCMVAASGQSTAIAVNAAAQTPELFERLILICPTTEADEVLEKVLWHGHWPPQLLGGIQKSAQAIASLPFLNTTFSNILTTRSVITAMARELFADEKFATSAFIDNLYISVHQPGTRAEVLSHLGGKLDIAWEEAWNRCEQPVLLIWGRQANADAATGWLALKPCAELEIIDEAKLLPHYEQSAKFLETVQRWLNG